MEVKDIEKLITDAVELDEIHVSFDGSQCKIKSSEEAANNLWSFNAGY